MLSPEVNLTLDAVPDLTQISLDEDFNIWEVTELSHWPVDFFGWWDMLIGFTIGWYLPFWQRSRDYDCFSKFAAMGNAIVNYFTYFDKAYIGDTFDILIVVAVAGVDAVNIGVSIDACI